MIFVNKRVYKTKTKIGKNYELSNNNDNNKNYGFPVVTIILFCFCVFFCIQVLFENFEELYLEKKSHSHKNIATNKKLKFEISMIFMSKRW